MKLHPSSLLVLAFGGVLLFAGARQDNPAPVPAVGLQDPVPADPAPADPAPADPAPADSSDQEPAEEQEQASRIDLLEKRVEILEGILFSSVKLETKRAQRLVTARQIDLKNSRALYAKGLITEFQLQQDRSRLEEARREFALAESQSNQKQLSSDLDLLDARRRLKLAKEQLQYRRNMAQRGYATQDEVRHYMALVKEATQELQYAEQKLEAAEQLESLQDSDK